MQRIQQGVDGYLRWKKGVCIFVLFFGHIFKYGKNDRRAFMTIKGGNLFNKLDVSNH
jgi:hypothetical protein